ncbi:daptide biosynthesis intramembrane metalloprotease [Actinomyces radicidentis]|uniref:daptide biosynthesis intramembrane metalloprotease n=1 Tax=Actinomyces radicidentis TaxID=111015 RepID=UPI0026E089A9|nr:daptide biosynthesis intramembrane metalloprotease [Actinomyces radicidentis]
MSDTTVLPPPLRLRPGVEVIPPQAERTRWIVRDARGRLLQVGPDLGPLLLLLAGSPGGLTAQELADRARAPWTPQLVRDVAGAPALHQLLTEDGTADAEQRPRALSVDHDGALVLKLCLNRVEPFFAACRPVLERLRRSHAGWLAVLTSLLGVLPLLQAIADPLGPLYRVMPTGSYLVVVVALLATTVVHELAHGLTLSALGGLPHRVGLMVFYLAPAAFCDVTDAWLLPRRHRVAVASAGVVAQTCLGAGALLGSELTDGAVSGVLAWYGAATYLTALINLLPLLKLDGYVALAGWLDRPNLRRDAIAATRSRLAGAPGAEGAPRWVLALGLGCVLAPVVAVWAGLLVLLPQLLRLGLPGLVVAVGLVLAAAACLLTGGARVLRELPASNRRRLALVSTALVALTLLVPVSASTSMGFEVQDDGTVLAYGSTEVIAASGASDDGAEVALHRAGLLTGPTLTDGTVTGTRTCSLPRQAVSPVRTTGTLSPSQCLLIVPGAGADRALASGTTGRVTITGPARPLAVLLRQQAALALSAL